MRRAEHQLEVVQALLAPAREGAMRAEWGGWMDDVEVKDLEHGSGLSTDELRRLFAGRGSGIGLPLGHPPPITLTKGPRLVDLLEWARDSNPQLRIEVQHRTVSLRVTSDRGEYIEHRRMDEPWIATFRRAGLLGRS